MDLTPRIDAIRASLPQSRALQQSAIVEAERQRMLYRGGAVLLVGGSAALGAFRSSNPIVGGAIGAVVGLGICAALTVGAFTLASGYR